MEWTMKFCAPKYITATISDERKRESTMKDFQKFRVGYNTFDTLEDASTEATKRAMKDWEDTTIWQAVKLAKFTMVPGTVVLEDVK